MKTWGKVGSKSCPQLARTGTHGGTIASSAIAPDEPVRLGVPSSRVSRIQLRRDKEKAREKP
jgi:hypothetical protein